MVLADIVRSIEEKNRKARILEQEQQDSAVKKARLLEQGEEHQDLPVQDDDNGDDKPMEIIVEDENGPQQPIENGQ